MSIEREIVAETITGKIEGSFEKGLYVFKGVPYAAPPVGELRWHSPQPCQPWKGIQQAKIFGPIAPQNLRAGPPLIPMREIEPQSENCLFLNIWTPGLDNARRPVMLWIHGGAFSIGSGSQEMYRGGPLVSRGNVVLVTINYRLGVLGFLNLNEVTRGGIPSTGNEGLLDQIAALEWVRDNIAVFGGDPNNVTIFGESAGGMSIGCLMNMPKARGLFHKAILESAVGEMARALEPSVGIAGEFLKIINLSADNIRGLQDLPVEKLLLAQQELAIRTGQGIAPVIPVAEGKVLPMMPLDSFAAGLAAEVPTLAGSNLEEEKLFAAMNPVPRKMDEAELIKNLQRLVPAGDAPAVIEAYRGARLKRGEPVAPVDIWSAVNTDLMFRKVALRVVESQCKRGLDAYNYLFTWKSPALGGSLGACHVLEIPFVFGNLDAGFCGAGAPADKLSVQMQDAWAAFARTGDPGTESLGEWPPYCSQKQTMVFGKDSHVQKSVYEEERHIWDVIGQAKMGNMT
jgi:para-nitrobenzyl esterase